MQRALPLLAFIACTPYAAPLPATPPPTPNAQEQMAQIQAQQRAATMAALADQNAKYAESIRAAEQQKAQLAQIETDRIDRENAERQAALDECARTRPARVAEAQAYARAWQERNQRLASNAKAIRAVCSVKDTRATRVEKAGDGTGAVLVRPVGRQDDLVCRGTLPPGISKEDAWEVLMAAQLPVGPVLSDSKYSRINGICRRPDLEAGFDDAISSDDAPAIAALLRWKAPE